MLKMYGVSFMKKKYRLTLSEDNPILNDHRVADVATFPGLAYFDLICQLAGSCLELGFDSYVVRKASFLAPLTVSSGQALEIEILLTEQADFWMVEIVRFVPSNSDVVQSEVYASFQIIKERVTTSSERAPKGL